MGFGGGACTGGAAGVVEAVRTGTVRLRSRQPIQGGISECPRLVVRLEVSFDRDRSLPAIQGHDRTSADIPPQIFFVDSGRRCC
jgi:hypothetical protein